jgi:hypothetical protein
LDSNQRLGMTDNKIAVLAKRLKKLADDYKANRLALIAEARRADVDPAALGRLVTYMRKDGLARLDQQAVDDQFRFHAGLRPTAAEIPCGGQLAMAASLYAEGKTVRAVADEMSISVGKAHKLKMEAAAFNVQAHMNMNTATAQALQPAAPDSEEDDTQMEGPKPVASGGEEDTSRAQASKLAADDLAIPDFLDRRAQGGYSATDPPNT